jgi:hypothetical protein
MVTPGVLLLFDYLQRWACLQQTSITVYRLPIKKNKLPFPFPANKRKLPFSVSSVFRFIYLYIYIYIHIYVTIYLYLLIYICLYCICCRFTCPSLAISFDDSSILLWVYTSMSSKIENNSFTEFIYITNNVHLIKM